MNSKSVWLVAIFLAAQAVPAVHAQHQVLTDSAEISLITITPGDALHQKFGHSALRVSDPGQELDMLFNYGTFQFDRYFLPKFVYGQLDYYLSVVPFDYAVEVYQSQQRGLIQQTLDLTPQQRNSLYRFLAVNALDENRYYRYDFVRDNCSTRIRDALKTVVGEDLEYRSGHSTPQTFRTLVRSYLVDSPFLDAGINMILGTPVDRSADAMDATFLPDYLMFAFDEAVIRTDLSLRPLVVQTDTLHWVDSSRPVDRTGLSLSTLLFALFFVLGIIVSYADKQRATQFTIWFDRILFFCAGLVGIVIAFLWFVSLHTSTINNLNLLWAWPAHFLVPFVLKRVVSNQKWLRVYFILASLLSVAVVLVAFATSIYLHPAAVLCALLLGLRCAMLGLNISKRSVA